MKFCPECGNGIDGMKFCGECGYKVEAADQGAAATAPAPTQTSSQLGHEKLNEEKTLLEFSTYLFGMEDKKKSLGKGIDLSLPRENYKLTNQRLLIEKQGITKKRDEIELVDINKIEVKQGLKEKMMGAGDINLDLEDGSTRTLKRIKEPFEIKDKIRKEVKLVKLRNNIEFRMDL